MRVHPQPPIPQSAPRAPQPPLGGAIIDAQNHEIAITEQMIQRACRELERQWVSPPGKHA